MAQALELSLKHNIYTRVILLRENSFQTAECEVIAAAIESNKSLVNFDI
jgi:hypothetical protein